MYQTILALSVFIFLLYGFYYIRLPSSSLFHPFSYYLMFHGLVFVIRPIMAYAYNFSGIYYAYEFSPSDGDLIKALIVANIGFIAFATTCISSGNHIVVFKRPLSIRPIDNRSIKSLLLVCILCLPISVWSISVSLAEKNSDVTTMVRDAATGFAINTSSNGYFTDSQLMIGPIVVLIAWVFKFRPISLIPFVLFVIAKAGTGGRWPFVMAAFSLCLAYLYEKRRRWLSAKVVAGVAVLGILFATIGLDRGASVRALFTGETLVAQKANEEMPLESMDFANKEFLEYLVRTVPDMTGTYGYFLDNLQILTEPIPRIFWTGKPVGAPIQLYSLFDYGYPIGMTFSLPGEGWTQAGWIGVIVWCALFGFILGKIYNRFMDSEQRPTSVAYYIIFVPLTIAFYRDGVLLTILRTSFFTLLPILLWHGSLRLFENAYDKRSQS